MNTPDTIAYELAAVCLAIPLILYFDTRRQTKKHLENMRRSDYLDKHGTQLMFNFPDNGHVRYLMPWK